jgi:hypothetical protein
MGERGRVKKKEMDIKKYHKLGKKKEVRSNCTPNVC